MRANHFITVVCAAMICTVAFAQTENASPAEVKAEKKQVNVKSHSIGVSLSAGYSNLFFEPQSVTNIGGVGGGAAFVYSYRHNAFRLRTGAGFDISKNWNTMEPFTYIGQEANYPGMTIVYDFKDYKETQRYATVYVPLMFGGQWDNFYFLIGGKLGVYPCLGHYNSEATYTVVASDPSLIDDIYDSNYGLGVDNPHQATGSGDLKFKTLNGMLSFEMGGTFEKVNLKKAKDGKAPAFLVDFGVFVDYGLGGQLGNNNSNVLSIYSENLNACKDADGKQGGLVNFDDAIGSNPVSTNPADHKLLNVKTMTYLGYNKFNEDAKAKLNNFLVGIKLTMSYEFARDRNLPKPEEKLPEKLKNADRIMVILAQDVETGLPITDAEIVATRQGNGAVAAMANTDYAGKAQFVLDEGSYKLEVNHADYTFDPVEMSHGILNDTVRLRVRQTYKPKITFSVQEMETNDIVPAMVEIYDGTGKLVYHMRLDSAETLMPGIFQNKDYTFRVFTPGPRIIERPVQPIRELENEVVMYKADLGKAESFILKNMYFATGKARILPSSQAALDELYGFLERNPKVRIMIVGHTDNTGTKQFNEVLSKDRAAGIRATMVARGIDKDRLLVYGKGSRSPLVKNDSEKNRQENRRVEIIILNPAEVNGVREQLLKQAQSEQRAAEPKLSAPAPVAPVPTPVASSVPAPVVPAPVAAPTTPTVEVKKPAPVIVDEEPEEPVQVKQVSSKSSKKETPKTSGKTTKKNAGKAAKGKVSKTAKK